jgi:hypothetical protein
MTKEEFAEKLAELANGKYSSYQEDVLNHGNGKIETTYLAGMAGLNMHVRALSWDELLAKVIASLEEAKAACPTCGRSN